MFTNIFCHFPVCRSICPLWIGNCQPVLSSCTINKIVRAEGARCDTQHQELRNRASPYGEQPQRQERTAEQRPPITSGDWPHSPDIRHPSRGHQGPSSSSGYDRGRFHSAGWLPHPRQRSPPQGPGGQPSGKEYKIIHILCWMICKVRQKIGRKVE